MPESPGDTDKREVDFDESNFVVYEYPSGVFEIQVVTNQSAFYYFLTHRLTAAELAHYREHGKPSLMRLANRVRKNGR